MKSPISRIIRMFLLYISHVDFEEKLEFLKGLIYDPPHGKVVGIHKEGQKRIP